MNTSIKGEKSGTFVAFSDSSDELDIDDNWHDRWDWVLDEMIWTFEEIGKVPEKKDMEAQDKRMKRGFTFFGKYYQDLWD